VVLWFAGALYAIAQRLRCDLEPIPLDFLDDTLAVAVQECEALMEAKEDLERYQQRRNEDEW
jgi:hypothetical protein